MPWNLPVSPTPGTTILVAYATANIVNPIVWLRLMTGNADPPGSDYVVVSTSASGTAWQKLPDAAMAVQKVTRDGDTMNGDLTVTRTSTAAPTQGFVFLGSNGGLRYIGYDGTKYVMREAGLTLDGGDLTTYRTGATTTGFVNFATGPSHFFGWDGAKFVMDGNTAWHSGNDGVSSALDAGLLGGVAPSGYALAANGVPSGLGGFFATAAGIAAGWTRYTAADGRLLVGAGTTFSQTFTENTAYGSTWTPFAGVTTPVSAETPFLAASSATNNSSGATNVNTAGHTHVLAAQTWLPVARAVCWATKT